MAAAEDRPPKRWTERRGKFSIALHAEGLTAIRERKRR